LVNDLALQSESPDAVTWTFKLRPQAKFHDVPPVNGHEVEAEDVKATFVRALTSPANPTRGTLNMIDPNQIETPASDTVVFKLRYPYAPLPNLLATPSYSEIFPREALSGGYDPSKQIIGSGPFVFESYTPDVALILKRNPDYYEKGLPYVDEVRMPIIVGGATNLAQFTTGNLDFLEPLDTDLETAKKSNPTAKVITVPGGSPNAYFYELGDPNSPFQDIRLRQAVSMAVDRNALQAVECTTPCQPVFSVPLAMGKWALRTDQLDQNTRQYYTFNLAHAKQLLQEAGDDDLQVSLVYPTNYTAAADRAKLGGAIYNMLKALPWKITLLPIDYQKEYLNGGKGMYYGNYPGNYLVSGGGTPQSETDLFLFNYYDSSSTSSITRLKDPTVDSMIQKARSTLDADSRRTAYLDVQKYLVEKAYTLAGLPISNVDMLVQPRVQNFNYAINHGDYGYSWARLWLKR
jgi:peptide/nickel transport system substrate-binding protein